MLDRRTFCRESAKALAMLVSAGRGASHAIDARPQSGSSATRRQVLVGGRRVRTVDVHAHCEVSGIRELMGGKPAGAAQSLGVERLRAMDAQGIDTEVLSINPFWYGINDRDLARKLIAAQNQGLSKL